MPFKSFLKRSSVEKGKKTCNKFTIVQKVAYSTKLKV
jgi:hypothetical protein